MFEIIDVTGDEVYFTLAVYSDYKTANEELDKRLKPDCAITESAEYEDYEKIQIRHRPIGWGSSYKIAFEIERFKRYNDVSDEYQWETIPLQFNASLILGL